jgi:hypothetical protein
MTLPKIEVFLLHSPFLPNQNCFLYFVVCAFRTIFQVFHTFPCNFLVHSLSPSFFLRIILVLYHQFPIFSNFLFTFSLFREDILYSITDTCYPALCILFRVTYILYLFYLMIVLLIIATFLKSLLFLQTFLFNYLLIVGCFNCFTLKLLDSSCLCDCFIMNFLPNLKYCAFYQPFSRQNCYGYPIYHLKSE